ncbi:MAG: DUF2235 domain-containing protein [Bacilli bacterium]|nr:DUF2235 domain-containing protein [Bacilli bacterium]
MGETSSFTESKNIKIEEALLQQKISDVYIGVFFDGTNNNMVQKARFTNTGKNFVTKKVQEGYYSVKKTIWYIADKTPFRDEEEYNVTLDDGYKPTEEQPSRGYSNIGILHDNCLLVEKWKESKSEDSICKLFYIEGSGATDTSQYIPGNPNGLGFGLGDTGVTALVSKAVKYITNYIKSHTLDIQNVKIHFYIFGFSRGATCARLFSRLITRGKNGEGIGREKEFSEHYAKGLFKNNKLNFLDDYKKDVEFLGIYDTVASIGFLLQKDGLPHPIMRNLYNWGDNYKDNWHYKNVYEYGLSLSDTYSGKIKQICHICAMDEFRENFALTDVGEKVPTNAIEIFIPGCHSDIGGGYVNETEEQEIVLLKKRRNNHPIKETTIKENNIHQDKDAIITKLALIAPNFKANESETTSMSIDGLVKLGWIDRNWNTKDKEEFKGKDSGKFKAYTLRAIENENEVKFKRNVEGVYSNISLKMMADFMASKMTPKSKSESESKVLIPDFISESFFNIDGINTYYKIPTELSKLGQGMCDVIKNASNGNRLWVYPKERYNRLRMKYLHFTCTSCENYHMNNPFNFKGVHTFEGTLGNLGNTPNFDLNGRLCRIVYHSPTDDQICQDVNEELHYMYEYGVSANSICLIECDKLERNSFK